tara:strand:- start:8 stop:223 length:216 start_codon:yes stop_codon:yes gene_type:complete
MYDTHTPTYDPREIVNQYRHAYITLREMYDRLILAQGYKCEVTGEIVDYHRLQRLINVSMMPREERRNSLS